MKTFFISGITPICIAAKAQTQNNYIPDGPYVFYHQKRMVIKSVQKRGVQYVVDSSVSPAEDNHSHLIRVHIEGHTEWNFKVQLRTQIIGKPVYSPGTNYSLAFSDSNPN